MARYSPLINNFHAGEWGPLTYARVDMQKFGASLKQCQNWIPSTQGPLRKRVGSTYIDEVDDMTKQSRLIPYVIGRTAAFQLEIAEGAINIFEADGTAMSVTFSGETPPWDPTEIKQIEFSQRADLLYFTHPDHPTYVFEFNGIANADLSIPDFDIGPLQDENVDTSLVVYAGAVTGSTTLTAGSAIFTADNVGGLFAFRCVVETLAPKWTTSDSITSGDYRWSNSYVTPNRVNMYKATSTGTTGEFAPGHDIGVESDGSVTWEMVHSEYGFARITAYTSTTVVDADVVGFPELPSSALTPGTWRWSFGSWAPRYGYPRTVGFYEQRLYFGGTVAEPQTLWGSRTADFTNFIPGDTSDSGSVSYTLDSDQFNPISWIKGGRNLFIGTLGGEFVANGGEIDAAITPTNIRIRRDSRHGSAFQDAIQVGEAILFVQAGGNRAREQLYQDARQGYVAIDLNVFAHHLGDLGLNKLTYQAEPDSIVWTFSNDGLLLGYTYERPQEVLGWHKHTLGGDAVVESVSVIPDENGVNDRLWVIVKRTIDGGVTRYIEFFNESLTTVWSDSAKIYSGAATDTITGLDHLEGEEVAVLADGAVHPNKTVSGGEITLDYDAEDVVVGLPMTAEMTTQTIEGGSETGVAQGKSKRIHNVSFRLVNTGPGLYVGPPDDDSLLQQVIYRVAPDLLDNPVPPLTSDSELVPLEDGYDDRGILKVVHNLPQPCTISAIWAQMEVYDAR